MEAKYNNTTAKAKYKLSQQLLYQSRTTAPCNYLAYDKKKTTPNHTKYILIIVTR